MLLSNPSGNDVRVVAARYRCESRSFLDAGFIQDRSVEGEADDLLSLEARLKPLESGLVFIDDGYIVPKFAASSEPTRPQPAMITCTRETFLWKRSNKHRRYCHTSHS
jgi:hypothetical protein